MQSRKLSLIETFVNIFTGWLISLILMWQVFPLFGINIPMIANLQLSAVFTVAAIIRGYFLRRFFNMLAIKDMQKYNKR